MRFEMVSVTLPRELRDFVRQKARLEDRSVAGFIRRLVTEAAQRETQSAPR
jgi:hypothetical protein